MKQNLLVVCYDYDISRQVAKDLAEVFSMRFFDQLDLFAFDNIPYTFSEVYSMNGEEYVKKKLKTVVISEIEFDNTTFSCDMSFADNCFEMFYKIKLANFVIFLHKTPQVEAEELKKKRYSSKEESKFFCMDENLLKKRELSISSHLADATINIEGLQNEEIINKIVDKIKEYYSVQ